jgi:hypothetical protein
MEPHFCRPWRFFYDDSGATSFSSDRFYLSLKGNVGGTGGTDNISLVGYRMVSMAGQRSFLESPLTLSSVAGNNLKIRDVTVPHGIDAIGLQ